MWGQFVDLERLGAGALEEGGAPGAAGAPGALEEGGAPEEAGEGGAGEVGGAEALMESLATTLLSMKTEHLLVWICALLRFCDPIEYGLRRNMALDAVAAQITRLAEPRHGDLSLQERERVVASRLVLQIYLNYLNLLNIF